MLQEKDAQLKPQKRLSSSPSQVESEPIRVRAKSSPTQFESEPSRVRPNSSPSQVESDPIRVRAKSSPRLCDLRLYKKQQIIVYLKCFISTLFLWELENLFAFSFSFYKKIFEWRLTLPSILPFTSYARFWMHSNEKMRIILTDPQYSSFISFQ